MKRKILCIEAIDGFLGRTSSTVAMYQFIFLHFLFKSVDRASRETVYDAVCEILSSIAVICSEDLLVTNSEDPQFFYCEWLSEISGFLSLHESSGHGDHLVCYHTTSSFRGLVTFKQVMLNILENLQEGIKVNFFDFECMIIGHANVQWESMAIAQRAKLLG